MTDSDDMISFDDDYNAARIDNSGVLRNLETATARASDALKESERSYQELLKKYEELKLKGSGAVVANGSSNESVTDPYVVVLVDADSHRFKHNLMHGAESGGGQAAKLLREAIAECIADRQSVTKPPRIVARVYANLKGLSLEFTAKHGNRKLLPKFPRGLAAFAAGFSREYASFDYVDVVDEESVERKISELFKIYAEDERCQHVFFGASGSAIYVRALGHHIMFSDKITLIQRGAVDTSLMHLGMKSATFSEVFDSLGGSNGVAPGLSDGDYEANVVSKRHFVGNASRKDSMSLDKPMRTRSTSTPQLPAQDIPERIPTNAAGHRIDPYMKAPTEHQWAQYKARFTSKKLCSTFYLGRGCERNVKICRYDHAPINSDIHYCLEYVLREHPCRYGGACRSKYCTRGHVCRRKVCVGGKSRGCKFPSKAHIEDVQIDQWVFPGEDRSEPEEPEESEDAKENAKGSMKAWGTRVGKLIDL